MVFKPSEETPLVGQLLADAIKKLNLPSGVFTIVHGAGDVGRQLAEANIDLLWFTGSSAVGQELYTVAAKKFIKVVFELGGSSPGLIFPDVDVQYIADQVYGTRFYNCGQSCSALKRLFVHKDIFADVVEALRLKLAVAVVGDPLDDKTDIGSLVAERQQILLEAQLADAIAKGAKVEVGGGDLEQLAGAYFAPTILTNVTNEMRVYNEEVFGPLLPIMSFSTEEEAITLANDTEYGLSAMIYTADSDRAARIAQRLQAGTVSINTTNYHKAECPFGGYKKSGLGREHGHFGFQELSQIKHIHRKL